MVVIQDATVSLVTCSTVLSDLYAPLKANFTAQGGELSKSIYEDLVERFKTARSCRQIIIITHNAHLVVNTDADQVIVANCGPHRSGYLPELSYQSGGLENAAIRKEVCEILESGETAFKERAKRQRMRIQQIMAIIKSYVEPSRLYRYRSLGAFDREMEASYARPIAEKAVSPPQ